MGVQTLGIRASAFRVTTGKKIAMTIEEHIENAERLLALAAKRDGELGRNTVALAEAHLHAADTKHNRQAREDSRQVSRDLKANQSFITDLMQKALPGATEP
jgi:hypothetical protein